MGIKLQGKARQRYRRAHVVSHRHPQMNFALVTRHARDLKKRMERFQTEQAQVGVERQAFLDSLCLSCAMAEEGKYRGEEADELLHHRWETGELPRDATKQAEQYEACYRDVPELIRARLLAAVPHRRDWCSVCEQSGNTSW